jgi:hypothetical protein
MHSMLDLSEFQKTQALNCIVLGIIHKITIPMFFESLEVVKIIFSLKNESWHRNLAV